MGQVGRLAFGLQLVVLGVAIPLIFKHLESKDYVEHFANLGFIVTSALVNFVCRKFIIFKH